MPLYFSDTLRIKSLAICLVNCSGSTRMINISYLGKKAKWLQLRLKIPNLRKRIKAAKLFPIVGVFSVTSVL